VGDRLAAVSGDLRETTFLWQRITALTQWFNAILIGEKFADANEAPDLYLFQTLLLIFVFRPLVLLTLGRNNNYNNNNSNNFFTLE